MYSMDLISIVYHNGCLGFSYWSFMAKEGIDLILVGMFDTMYLC